MWPPNDDIEPAETIDGVDYWEYESLLDFRIVPGVGAEVLVKWVMPPGAGASYTWEPVRNVFDDNEWRAFLAHMVLRNVLQAGHLNGQNDADLPADL
ncbi:hypothetical protein Ddc_23981 [Ditylenchus destructor]|nr:hypothetical protein Ddc_23981 [Ditylenchus destructor]